MVRVHYPSKFYAEFNDGERRYYVGFSEEECIENIANDADDHGGIDYYTGVNDEDYVDGEYVGRENFIYE